MSTFNISILAADRNFYNGECESVVIPTAEGKRGILANHSNMIEAIIPGKLKYTMPGEKQQEAFVSYGMIKVEEGEVLILVDSIELPEEVDINRAKRAEADAMEAALQKKSREEYFNTKIKLARTMNKLKGKQEHEVK